MRILKSLALAFVATSAVFLIIGLFLPRDWKVVQSVQINATPEDIHPLVESPRAWEGWGMWDKASDPELKHTFSGPERGVGATIAWNSPNSGRGKITFTRSDPAAGVWFDEAIEAEEINAHGSITYAVAGEVTTVTWTDEGTLPPVIGGYFRSMINQALGKHFQTALEKLKAAAEKQRTARLAP